MSLSMWQGLGEIYTALGKRAGRARGDPDRRGRQFLRRRGHLRVLQGAQHRRRRRRSTMRPGSSRRRRSSTCRSRPSRRCTGYGVGGGCGLALACDLRVGDATTQMGIPAARLSIVYSTIDCDLLLRAVGLANAKLVLYSGRYFKLAECRAMGLVNIVSADGALAGARALARGAGGAARRCRSAAPRWCWRRWRAARRRSAPARSRRCRPRR